MTTRRKEEIAFARHRLMTAPVPVAEGSSKPVCGGAAGGKSSTP